MNYKYLYILISFLCFPQLQAQFCIGSLGDPVENTDFDYGSAGRGYALQPSITAYTYSSSGQLEDGQYTITNSTAVLNRTDWHITSDHTGNPDGYMMVFNSSSVTADKILYTKRISGLCPGITYEISAWIMNLLLAESPNPNVTIRLNSIDGTLLRSISTGDILATDVPEWKQYGFCIELGSVTDVVITLLNSSPNANPGNALALDDIYIRACGPQLTASIEGIDTPYFYRCPIMDKIDYTLSGNIKYEIGQTALNELYSQGTSIWQELFYDKDGKAFWSNTKVDYNSVFGRGMGTTVSTYGSAFRQFRLCVTPQNADPNSKSCRICSNVVTFDFQRPDKEPYLEITQPTCDLPTGTIRIDFPLGVMYSIDGVNFQSSPIFSGLKGGNYYVQTKGTCDLISLAQRAHINSTPISTFSVIQPASCVNPFGTITITSSGDEFSFDDGATWTTNNVKSGLVVGDYLVKTRGNSNCETTAALVSILVPPDSPLTPTVTVTQPDCLLQTGTITVSDAAAEYSFDNGLTWTTSNSRSNLIVGKYNVLLKNTLGCISYVSKEVEIKAYINTEPLPVVVTPQQFCVQQNATLNDIAITGTNVKWYDAAVNGNLLPATTVMQSGTYYATQTVSICESSRIPVEIKIQNTPIPTGAIIQDFCTTQKPTIASLVATGTTIKWYDSATNGTVFPMATALVNGVTYYATQTVNGCESANRLAVLVTIVSPSIPVNDVSDLICDDKNDGSELVDLTSYQSQITSNYSVAFAYFPSLSGAENKTTAEQITTPKNYNLTLGTTIIYVRIDSNDKCYQVVQLNVTLVSNPKIPVLDIVPLCEKKEVTIDAGSGFDSYLWSTGATSESVTVDKVGSYWVMVTKNYGSIICSSTKSFSVVLSNIATISEIKIQDWTDAENVIVVELTNNSMGDYEYSLDGISYQESNVFNGLRSGNYTVYVRDKNNCGTVNQEVFVLNYPKYFTPNGDGNNDTWAVRFSGSEPNINTKIFDRYGKMIKELNGNSSSWDGTYNGNELPATDYWFVVTRENGKVMKGHFAIKR